MHCEYVMSRKKRSDTRDNGMLACLLACLGPPPSVSGIFDERENVHDKSTRGKRKETRKIRKGEEVHQSIDCFWSIDI